MQLRERQQQSRRGRHCIGRQAVFCAVDQRKAACQRQPDPDRRQRALGDLPPGSLRGAVLLVLAGG